MRRQGRRTRFRLPGRWVAAAGGVSPMAPSKPPLQCHRPNLRFVMRVVSQGLHSAMAPSQTWPGGLVLRASSPLTGLVTTSAARVLPRQSIPPSRVLNKASRSCRFWRTRHTRRCVPLRSSPHPRQRPAPPMSHSRRPRAKATVAMTRARTRSWPKVGVPPMPARTASCPRPPLTKHATRLLPPRPQRLPRSVSARCPTSGNRHHRSQRPRPTCQRRLQELKRRRRSLTSRLMLRTPTLG